MDDRQEVDVESIVQHIRENLRSRRMASAHNTPESPLDDGHTAEELATLHHNYDIYRLHLTSHRQVFGWFIVLAKTLVRQLLTPSLERQVAYNAANMRISSWLCDLLKETHAQLQETRERQAMVHSKVESLAYQQGQLRGEIEAVGQRQASDLQALQAALLTQVDDWGQQQVRSLQALQQTIIAQIEVMGQRLRERDLRLADLEQALMEVRANLKHQERQLSLLLEPDKKPVSVNHAQV